MMKYMPSWKYVVVVGVVGLVFFGSRLAGLTSLPVFADEAIYIRWAQLMNQDFPRYAFFPMQDGKPPLFMWGLKLWLPLFPGDPLLAARLMNVALGAVSLGLISWFTYLLSASKIASLFAGGLYILLPFTFFFDRMGLIDPLVTLFTAMILVGVGLETKQHKGGGWLIGLGTGLGLMTKTTMIIILAVIALMSWYVYRRQKLATSFLIKVGSAFGIGGLLFLSLRLSPSFGALFTRSGDFTFSLGEILAGQRIHILTNGRAIWKWLEAYFTLPGVGLLVLGSGWWMGKRFKAVNSLSPSALFIIGTFLLLPYVVFGQVITARYFLPVVAFFIPAMALIFARLWDQHRVVAVVTGTLLVMASVRFNQKLIVEPGLAPLPHEEQVQYLTEWSSGYGIPEVRDFIRSRAVNARVVVATEGYFGTLPDGLLMYFDQSPLIANVEIYGIGVPIKIVPSELLEKARVDEAYLVVNSHRFLIDPLPSFLELVAKYPRPLNGPSLLFFKVNADEISTL